MSPEEFRRIRKAARVSQAAMAERLDVSRKTIVNWEGGIFAIPEDALITLQERGVAEMPAIKPVTPASHPHFYDAGKLRNTFMRNHKHPHWFARASWLGSFMTEAEKTAIDAMTCTTEDIEKYQWTPARAVAFARQFNKVIGWGGKPMSQEIAEEIARQAGFDVPLRLTPERTRAIAYNTALAEWNAANPDAPGWSNFETVNPQYRDNQSSQASGEPDPAIVDAFESAFSLTSTQEK